MQSTVCSARSSKIPDMDMTRKEAKSDGEDGLVWRIHATDIDANGALQDKMIYKTEFSSIVVVYYVLITTMYSTASLVR